MPIYQLRFLDEAVRNLAGVDRGAAERISRRIEWPPDSFVSIRPELLKAELTGCYKLRVGDYCVIYQVYADKQLIVIRKIGHRREVYRAR